MEQFCRCKGRLVSAKRCAYGARTIIFALWTWSFRVPTTYLLHVSGRIIIHVYITSCFDIDMLFTFALTLCVSVSVFRAGSSQPVASESYACYNVI